MTDMDLDAIDELLMELTEYGSNLMLSEGLPTEVVADAIDNVLDLRNLAAFSEEEE